MREPGVAARRRGTRAPVHPYYPTHLDLGVLGSALPAGALDPVPEPWVTFPRLSRAECRREGGASWLHISERSAPGDRRPRLVNSLGPGWGLHLVDVNVVLGDLVDLVRRQARTWETG